MAQRSDLFYEPIPPSEKLNIGNLIYLFLSFSDPEPDPYYFNKDLKNRDNKVQYHKLKFLVDNKK